MPYHCALFAVDLTEESEFIVRRGMDIFDQRELIHLIHVVKPLSYTQSGDIPVDMSSIQTQTYEHAKESMEQLANQFQIPQKNTHIVVGRPENEVALKAQELEVDLVILGNHARTGLAASFLGSSTKGLLKQVRCDVLTLYIEPIDNA